MKIGVIMGGTSEEREVSLSTGKEIIASLNRNKYEVVEIIINSTKDLIEKIQKEGIEFAFLALHGKFGEDGTAQAILEGLKVPYSGSGILASSLCMNKDITKRLMRAEGITTAPWITLRKQEEIDYEKLEDLGYPFVVKPVNGGSSIGTQIVRGSEDVLEAVLKAFDYDEEIMLENYLSGKEITCSMIDGRMYPIIEIKPSAEFFDYKSKYDDKGSEEIIIELEDNLNSKVAALCYRCWNLFKCSVYGRIDIIVADNEPYVLEINTLPGMTKNSLLPKSAKAAGLSFPELLDKIITLSFNIRK